MVCVAPLETIPCESHTFIRHCFEQVFLFVISLTVFSYVWPSTTMPASRGGSHMQDELTNFSAPGEALKSGSTASRSRNKSTKQGSFVDVGESCVPIAIKRSTPPRGGGARPLPDGGGIPTPAVVAGLGLGGGIPPAAMAPRFGEGGVYPPRGGGVGSPAAVRQTWFLIGIGVYHPCGGSGDPSGGYTTPRGGGRNSGGRGGGRPPSAAVAVRTCQVGGGVGAYPPPRWRFAWGGVYPPRRGSHTSFVGAIAPRCEM